MTRIKYYKSNEYLSLHEDAIAGKNVILENFPKDVEHIHSGTRIIGSPTKISCEYFSCSYFFGGSYGKTAVQFFELPVIKETSVVIYGDKPRDIKKTKSALEKKLAITLSEEKL